MAFFKNRNAKSMDFGSLYFQCNICGNACRTQAAELSREVASCKKCGSSVRMRSIIHLLSMEVFGKSLPLPEFPARQDISGAGLSDWEGYAVSLARKFSYKNTYYHQPPRLDITDIDPKDEGTLDFLISSDVFEHIPPAVSVAFDSAYRLLKKNGVFIFTAPYTLLGKTIEHFPNLHHYEIVEKGGSHFLKNITDDGREEIFEDLVFHGGPGATLEMRMFSQPSLLEEFAKAGFRQIKMHRDVCFEFGVFWNGPSAVPISARKLFSDSKPQAISLPKETNDISLRIERFLQTEYLFEFEGWAYLKNEDTEDAEIFIALESDRNKYVFDSKQGMRPDVSEYFKKPNLDNSGFYASISKEGIEKGTYKASCYIRKKSGVEALQFMTTVLCS